MERLLLSPNPDDIEVLCPQGCYWACEHQFPPPPDRPAYEPPEESPEDRHWRETMPYSVNE